MPHVVIIDDEYSVRMVLKAMCERDGHSVETASSGAEGLERFRSRRPDVTICDLSLADVSGEDVVEEILGADANASIILLSGTGDVFRAARTFAGKRVRPLGKPVSMRDLLAAVRDATA